MTTIRNTTPVAGNGTQLVRAEEQVQRVAATVVPAVGDEHQDDGTIHPDVRTFFDNASARLKELERLRRDNTKLGSDLAIATGTRDHFQALLIDMTRERDALLRFRFTMLTRMASCRSIFEAMFTEGEDALVDVRKTAGVDDEAMKRLAAEIAEPLPAGQQRSHSDEP